MNSVNPQKAASVSAAVQVSPRNIAATQKLSIGNKIAHLFFTEICEKLAGLGNGITKAIDCASDNKQFAETSIGKQFLKVVDPSLLRKPEVVKSSQTSVKTEQEKKDDEIVARVEKFYKDLNTAKVRHIKTHPSAEDVKTYFSALDKDFEARIKLGTVNEQDVEDHCKKQREILDTRLDVEAIAANEGRKQLLAGAAEFAKGTKFVVTPGVELKDLNDKEESFKRNIIKEKSAIKAKLCQYKEMLPDALKAAKNRVLESENAGLVQARKAALDAIRANEAAIAVINSRYRSNDKELLSLNPVILANCSELAVQKGSLCGDPVQSNLEEVAQKQPSSQSSLKTLGNHVYHLLFDYHHQNVAQASDVALKDQEKEETSQGPLVVVSGDKSADIAQKDQAKEVSSQELLEDVSKPLGLNAELAKNAVAKVYSAALAKTLAISLGLTSLAAAYAAYKNPKEAQALRQKGLAVLTNVGSQASEAAKTLGRNGRSLIEPSIRKNFNKVAFIARPVRDYLSGVISSFSNFRVGSEGVKLTSK